MDSRIDRRIFERIDAELAVRYNLKGSKKEHYALTSNLSGGGIRMSVLKKITPGTIVDMVVFRESSDAASRCKAEVVWVDTKPYNKNGNKVYDVGIRFMESSFLCIGKLINELIGKQQNKEAVNILG
ncbi:MAG: PilZ domain-containing protein [Candidatus Omnitrophota bacterium]